MGAEFVRQAKNEPENSSGERRGQRVNTIKMAGQALVHPLEFFYDIQFQGRAKLKHAVVMIGLTVFAHFAGLVFTGFVFQTREPYQISFVVDTIWIILPWITWSIVNWGIGAIVDGEGKFKDILVGSSFVFVPYILLTVPLIMISNILSLKESSIYAAVSGFMFVWVILLILMQVKVIHDFELSKTVWVTLLSGFGMMLIWFIGLLVFGLVNQSVQFVLDLYKELSFRL
jgi:hypothetical protein